MDKLKQLKGNIKSLSRAEAEQLQDWLSDYLENEAELNPAFVASIERGHADLDDGRVRVLERPLHPDVISATGIISSGIAGQDVHREHIENKHQ